MEGDDGRLLIGIGCNVCAAPTVATDGSESGRPATALAMHNDTLRDVSGDDKQSWPHRMLGSDIFHSVVDWTRGAREGDGAVRAGFEALMDMRTQRLRDATHTNVTPIRLNEDGSLEVCLHIDVCMCMCMYVCM